MVLPAAAAAVHAAGAGATALGLGMGKSDLDLTRALFAQQMQQAKRLWTADFCTSSVRHAEACQQAAVQHQQAVNMATAAYCQAEKLSSAALRQAAQQDARAYEMAWRSEVRESLRDELANQNNRFNMFMLCDTVCLSCVFSLIADGSPPQGTPSLSLQLYLGSLGVSTTLFTISMWCCVVVVRRLHEHTAATLEQKIWASSHELQLAWQAQLHANKPTGPAEMHLVNAAYEAWLDQYVNGLGNVAIYLLSTGVVAMFVTAGLLTHVRYQQEYDDANTAVNIFWSTVVITCTAVLLLKWKEDKMEKTKAGVYDVSWQDNTTARNGPFAKISKWARQLGKTVAALGGIGGAGSGAMETLLSREKQALEAAGATVHDDSNHNNHNSARRALRSAAQQRALVRKQILQLLTAAPEELDALPEELLAKLNRLLHDVDDADAQMAQSLILATTTSQHNNQNHSRRHNSQSSSSLYKESSSQWRRQSLDLMASTRPTSLPVDAQQLPVSLAALRKKLGEISLTTLLRIQNKSAQPLRLVSGVKLKEGRYIKSLTTAEEQHNQTLHLYPVAEIAPFAEVVMVARSGGGWLPTSGIAGQVVYTNRQETWTFTIRFVNELVRGHRRCHVQATRENSSSSTRQQDDADRLLSIQTSTTNSTDGGDLFSDEGQEEEQYWHISREVLDRKANNEILVCIEQGQFDPDAVAAAAAAVPSATRSWVGGHYNAIKSGFLLKNRPYGLRLQWQQRWFVLTSAELVYAHDKKGRKQTVISLDDIVNVRPASEQDVLQKFILEIVIANRSDEPLRLAASSAQDRDDWIQAITEALQGDASFAAATDSSEGRANSDELGSIELVQGEMGITQVLPV